MPTARLGAPPVRDSSVASPICCASCVICSGRSMNPHWAIACAALSGVVPRIAGPTFIAK